MKWDVVIDTNLKAVSSLSRGVMRGMMKARFGRIVNISSVVRYPAMPVRPITAQPRRASLVDPFAGA